MGKIIVLGGGFGGLEAARTAKKTNKNHEVLVIDHSQYMTMHAHLHEVVSERMKPEDIEIDLEKALKKVGANFLKAEIKTFTNGLVHTSEGDFKFDALIIAMGSKTCFAVKGMNSCDELKQTFHAKAMHDHLLKSDKGKVVVVGAGLTGVELVFEIEELGKKYDKHFNIHLVEANDGPLPHFPEKARTIVRKELDKKNIVGHYGKKIIDCSAHNLKFDNGINLDFDLLVWTAGIEPVANAKTYGLKSSLGFIKVDEHLMTSAKGVFAVGDVAWYGIGAGHELWTAVTAINEGKVAGYNAAKYLDKKPMKNYTPHKKHTFLISLGSKKGLYVRGNKVISGWLPLKMKYAFKKQYLKSRR